jgi:DNA-binding response OmpR family regulator
MTEAEKIAKLEAEVEALRGRVDELERQLAPCDIVPPQLGATLRERQILAMLMSRQIVRTEAIMVLCGDDTNGEIQRDSARVRMCLLRKKLPPEAKINTAYGEGYWMDEKSKAAVRALAS